MGPWYDGACGYHRSPGTDGMPASGDIYNVKRFGYQGYQDTVKPFTESQDPECRSSLEYVTRAQRLFPEVLALQA